ncbi:fused MFS/spermidine synthase [Benzoatithermus flavus]|uniref:Fused MFS/spermidine synthase n=1 Tax=Benzoatithermus flavus TaxID=3108223 RepID=A0ABU8XNA4_9PROT
MAPLHGAFFLSGFSALVYQTSWQRMLGLFAGSDAVAATLVVGSFLFGLGIGSLVGAMIADRLSARGAVRAFGLCEVGIGACALLSGFVLEDVLFRYVVPLHPSSATVACVVLATLFLPTLLMGMSLPFLARAAVDRIETASARIGWLYGVNTLGAAAGALLAGFLLIGNLGFDGAVEVGALISLGVGAIALVVSGRLPGGVAVPKLDRPAADRSDSAQLVGWSLAVFVSGFLIISLEIVWFRLLGTMMQSSPYAFALVLAIFLLADAVGIVWGAKVVARVGEPRRLFMAQQALMALLALGAIVLLHAANSWLDLPQAFVLDTAYKSFGKLAGEVRTLAWIVLTLILVFPPAFLLGMSFPIVQKAVQNDLGQVGRRVGLIQLANILGNTAGALVTGLVLLHLVGTSGTLHVIGIAGLVFAFLLLRELPGNATMALAAALALVIAVLPGNAPLWARIHGTAPEAALVGEDRTGTAVVRSRPEGIAPGARADGTVPRDAWVLYVGGRWQSQMNPYASVQGAMGTLASLVHPDPEKVLLIGYGGGGALWASMGNPLLKRIEVVEIVRPVVSVMRAYGELHDGVVPRLFHDPRVRVSIGDGRHKLLTDPELYDVILAEAIVPKAAHSGALFSREFFEQVRSRLKPGGIAVEWAATGRVVDTFRQVFPYGVRVGGALIGSNQPFPFSLDEVAARLRASPTREHLNEGGWDPEELVAWLSSRPVESWSPENPPPKAHDINTDLFPKDEYFLNNPASPS